MKKYTIHTIDLDNETSRIEYLEHGWLKVINAKLWLDKLGDWNDITYTRIFPSNRILWIDEDGF